MNPKKITPAEIAEAMKMTDRQIWSFARKLDAFFKPTRVQRIGSKEREIDAPIDTAKKKLKLLHRWFSSKKMFHTAAHGGIKGRSCFSSAHQHLGKKFVWTRDAKDCYPSITPEMFFRELKNIGFRHDTATLLTRICTLRGRVPQGSPVSNDAVNLYFWCIDQLIRSSGGTKRVSYSRVADDFVLSGNKRSEGEALVRRLESELQQRHIRINKKKREKSGFQINQKLVHNIRVENRRGTKISEEHWKIILDLAKSYQIACKRVQPSTLEAVAWKRQQLNGYLNYSKQADLTKTKHITNQLKIGDRFVSNKLKGLRLHPYKGKWWLVSSKRNEPRNLKKAWLHALV